jgi:hypothetical protein
MKFSISRLFGRRLSQPADFDQVVTIFFCIQETFCSSILVSQFEFVEPGMLRLRAEEHFGISFDVFIDGCDFACNLHHANIMRYNESDNNTGFLTRRTGEIISVCRNDPEISSIPLSSDSSFPPTVCVMIPIKTPRGIVRPTSPANCTDATSPSFSYTHKT